MEMWKVNVLGKRCSTPWEISVVCIDNVHGQRSYGWFGPQKILVGYSGAGQYALYGFVWDRHIETAEMLCERLNAGMFVG